MFMHCTLLKMNDLKCIIIFQNPFQNNAMEKTSLLQWNSSIMMTNLNTSWETLARKTSGNQGKHEREYGSHGSDFVPYGISSVSSFNPVPQELLDRIFLHFGFYVHVLKWDAHAWIRHQLCVFVMLGVAGQNVVRRIHFDGHADT